MKRNAFLKFAGSTALVAGARLALPGVTEAAAATREVSFAGALYRAGGPGKIEVSKNGGRTWKLHSNIGDINTIKSLAIRGGRLHLNVVYGGHSFPLVLAKDKRSWLTA